MRAKLITIPPSAGSAPPLSPVPDPRATNGMRCWAQMRTMACTCSALRGRTTASGHSAEVGQAVALIRLELVCLGNQATRFTRVFRVYGRTQGIEDRPIDHKRS